MKNSFAGFNLDFAGFTASLACAVHCAAIPLILLFTPFASLGAFGSPVVEVAVIFLSLSIAATSLLYSYKKFHKSIKPLGIAAAGFITLAIGHSMSADWIEIAFTVTGAILIAGAHYINWKKLHTGTVRKRS